MVAIATVLSKDKHGSTGTKTVQIQVFQNLSRTVYVKSLIANSRLTKLVTSISGIEKQNGGEAQKDSQNNGTA